MNTMKLPCVLLVLALIAAPAVVALCLPQHSDRSPWLEDEQPSPLKHGGEWLSWHARLSGIHEGCTHELLLAKWEEVRVGRTHAYEFGSGELEGGVYELDDEWQLSVTFAHGRVVSYRVEPVLAENIGPLRPEIGEELYYTIRLIHKSPPVGQPGFDPLALIRAVNHLRSLGKEQAIKALKRYVEIANTTGYRSKVRGLNEERVLPILGLLFCPQVGRVVPATQALLGLVGTGLAGRAAGEPAFPTPAHARHPAGPRQHVLHARAR